MTPDQSGPSEIASAERARWLAEKVSVHEPALRSYLRSEFPSLEADDVVQESYLKLMRMRAVSSIASTKAYFFSIARNTALTIFRRRRLFSDFPVNELAESLVLDPRPDGSELANARQRLELAVKAIDHLPARCREVLKLAALEGKSTAEIAAQLNISENTVRVQLARGIKKCAQFLRDQEGRQ